MSKEIRHSFLIGTSPDAIASALMEAEQIQRWWTQDARIQGNKLVVSWSGYGWEVTLEPEYDMPGQKVAWKCVKSNMQNTDAWEGTVITFVLKPDDEGTRIEFSQSGYRESPCYDVCVQGWEFFVGTSLKQYVETGKGIPYPEILDTGKA
jgi:uncharacterized protein YndB with AHSA1/START domain